MADPVADFLAREQDMLAGLEGAVQPAAAEILPVVAADIADDFGGLAMANPIPAVPANPLFDEQNTFPTTDSGVDLAAMDFQGAAPLLNGGASVSPVPPFNVSNGPSPIPAIPRIEAENIRKWREQQREMLDKKDAEEEKKKEEWRAQAKRELEDWYAQREATLAKVKGNNRKAEAEYAEQRDREQGSDAAWDEIAKLCDTKPKAGMKDISRMKSLLMMLKNYQN